MINLMIKIPKDLYDRIKKSGSIEKYGSDLSTVTDAIIKGEACPEDFTFNLDPECSKCAGFEPEARQTLFYADMNKVHSTEITCRMIEQCRWLKKNAEGLREH